MTSEYYNKSKGIAVKIKEAQEKKRLIDIYVENDKQFRLKTDSIIFFCGSTFFFGIDTIEDQPHYFIIDKIIRINILEECCHKKGTDCCRAKKGIVRTACVGCCSGSAG